MYAHLHQVAAYSTLPPETIFLQGFIYLLIFQQPKQFEHIS